MNEFEVWHDDSKTLALEELANYTWTEEDEEKMAAIVKAAFKKYKLDEETP